MIFVHRSKTTLFSSLVILSVVGMTLTAPPKIQIQSVDPCPAKTVSTPTFAKTYHLRDLTDGFSVVPTKDGGYLLSGDTLTASGISVPYPFLVKVNAMGNVVWSKELGSQSLPPRDSSTSHEPHVAVETTDGGIVAATDIVDQKFIDADYETNLKEVGDVLITKTNSKGVRQWATLLGDYSVDRPQKMWALPDGGVMLLAQLAATDHEPDVADMDAVIKYSVLIRIDKNGKATSVKKFDWEAIDMQRLDDGSFIALANLAIPKTGLETTMSDLPTVIRLRGDLSTTWAKSMEMIPSEFNTPTVSNGVLVPGKTTVRIMGGDFKAVQQTPDGGFLAVGFDNLLLTKGLSGGTLGPITSYTPRSFVAVKFDAGGYYKWAKKLSVNLTSSITGNDLQMIKTTDGKFVIMQDIIRASAGIDEKYQNASKNAAGMSAWADALATTIEIMKIDADANPMWVKQVDMERNLSGFSLVPTADNGVILAGSMTTTREHKTVSGMVPYKEAALVKLDANGTATGCADVSAPAVNATVTDQSQYLVSQSMSIANADDMVLKVNKKVIEKVSTAKNTARNICQYKKTAIAPACTYLTPVSAAPNGSAGSFVPVAKTWALINYENAKEVAAEGEKNIAVNAELLPILNEVYSREVKLKDNMKSMWLTYIFSRLPTRADVEAIQKKYEALGYRVDESEGGRLYVSKIGLTVHMTFSITSSMVGQVEVLF